MSEDEILASSLWPWPDPLFKRDPSGLVLFVNAAFLQLYGGQVQDWCGKPLAGWPAPVTTGAQRFETRIGAAPNETVFDWVESVLVDGNALAIARNVTIFMAAPAPVPEPVPQIMEEAPAQVAVPTPPIPEPASVPAQLEQLSEQSPELPLEPPTAAPDISSEFEFGDTKAQAPQSAVPGPPVADQVSQEVQAPVQSPVQAPIQAPIQAQETTPAPAQQTPPPLQPAIAPATEPREDKRMMERRALPIEDSTNVLGASWRDDVIAKAVGGSSSSEEIAESIMPAAGAVVARFGEGLQILLAEDNAINALLTRTLLEAEGAHVDAVEDGALALEAVGQKQYDLIFMDMRMPNMDGLEATRKIRAFGYTKPIIALTAHAFDDDRNACFDSGMNDFMTKPVSAEELSEMVINWTKEEEKKIAS